MCASAQHFWTLFFQTFDKHGLLPAFTQGWQEMLADDRPELDGVLRHIAGHLRIKPRQLRKMSDRRRAALLLPKLGDIAFLSPYVTDAHYIGRHGPSVSRFLDGVDVPHNAYNVVPRGVALPSAAHVFESVEACIAEERSLLAIYRYLTVQSALVTDWRRRAAPAIDHIAAVCPNLSSTFDDDLVTQATPSAADRRREALRQLETAFEATYRADRLGNTTWQAAHDLLAEQADHPGACRAIGRIRASRDEPCLTETAPSAAAGDWMLVAYLEYSHRHASASVFTARARAASQRLCELAGRGEAPAQRLSRHLLATLWESRLPEPVIRLLATTCSILNERQRWHALGWSTAAADTDIEQRLLRALARHAQTVTGAPIGVFGRAVTYALARAYHRTGDHERAQAQYDALVGVDHSDETCWAALLNRLRATDINAMARRLIVDAAHAPWRSPDADLRTVRITLARLVRSSAPEIAGPAAYLLGTLESRAADPVTAPSQQTAARLAEACRHARTAADTESLWAAHAAYLHRLVAYQRTRIPDTAFDWTRLAPLLPDLPETDWQRLFILADAHDSVAADALADRLVAHDIALPWPAGAKPRHLARSEAIRTAWAQQAAHPATGLRRAFDILCCLFIAYRNDDHVEASRHTLERIETLADSRTGAALVAAWLDSGVELAPAWSPRCRLWLRLRLAERTADTAKLPAIITTLFFDIRDSDPFAAGELIALARHWGCHPLAADLAAALPALGQSLPDKSVGKPPVSVVFVGGNEIQARREGAVRARLSRDGANVSVAFHHVGWDGNWGRRVDTLLAECNRADAVVIMPYIRTQFGRTLRAALVRPWIACPGTGRDAMVRSIHEAGRVARRQRHTNA